ncbi:hypothetical protein [Streptomyces sp. NPDC021356]
MTAVREITRAYRHRVLIQYDSGAMAALARPADDVEAELWCTLAETAR